MNPRQIPLALALALVTAAMASCAQDNHAVPAAQDGAIAETADANADAHAHDPAHADAVAHASGIDFPVPNNHQPWTPDAPLIEGMSRVRAAITGLEGQPGAAAVEDAAASVDAAVAHMFENCQLDVEPDIALHAILARLMAGAQALHANPGDTSPVADMHAAVENYERLFDERLLDDRDSTGSGSES